jgi:hypothetical protein
MEGRKAAETAPGDRHRPDGTAALARVGAPHDKTGAVEIAVTVVTIPLLHLFTVFGIIAPVIQAVLFVFIDMPILLFTATTKGQHAAHQDQRYLQGASSAHRSLQQMYLSTGLHSADYRYRYTSKQYSRKHWEYF